MKIIISGKTCELESISGQMNGVFFQLHSDYFCNESLS